MHLLLSLCQWLEHTAVGTAVRESTWLFPTIETVHILGMTILVGATWMLNLHLLNFSRRPQPFSEAALGLLPWLWLGFGVNFLTGFLIFSAEATKMYNNSYFRIKMLLIFVLAVNAVLFRLSIHRTAGWKGFNTAPMGFRVAGCIALLLWVGVIAASRWVAYL